MKKLKPIFVVLFCFAFAAGLRAGLNRWFPNVYRSIWGGPAIVEKAPLERAIATVTKEDKNDKSTETVARGGESEIFATGRVRFRDRVLVQFSDGTVRTDQDNDVRARLTRVTSNYADFDGKRYYFKPARPDGVAADRRPLNAASEPPSPNGRAPVEVGKTEAVASGPLGAGS